MLLSLTQLSSKPSLTEAFSSAYPRTEDMLIGNLKNTVFARVTKLCSTSKKHNGVL